MSPPDRSPLVSVVIVGDGASAWSQALTTVAEQEYEPIEVVLVMDGGDPGDLERLEMAADTLRSRFVRVVVRRNGVTRGEAFSMHRGAALATGTLLSFLDAADAYQPDRLTRCVEAMRGEGDGSWAYTSVLPEYVDGRPAWSSIAAHWVHWRQRLGEVALPTLGWGMLEHFLPVTPCNLVMGARLARALAGLRWDHLDPAWDLALRALARAEPLFVPGTAYRFRERPVADRWSLDRARGAGACRQDYFRLVCGSRTENWLAPSPDRWPGTFHALAQEVGARADFDAVYDPYRRYHRTVTYATASSGIGSVMRP